MGEPLETCWTMVNKAADGDDEACGLFAHTYLAIVRAYLARRWRGSPAIQHLDDAVQDVFLDLFRADGALGRLDPERAACFRSFLFGVAHKVALRHEERAARRTSNGQQQSLDPDATASPHASVSSAFDREWAQCLLQRAGQRQADRAADARSQRRVELLRLRFGEGLPIREIAKLWDMDPKQLHREYGTARDEFKEALRAEVRFHHTGSSAAIERECQNLLGLLS